MGICSWLQSLMDGVFRASAPPRPPGPEAKQTAHSPELPTSPRTRYSTKMQQSWDPVLSPAPTATTTGSCRSQRRRPRRAGSRSSSSQFPSSPVAATAPSSPSPRSYPRPATPKPSHEPYRHMERELREASLTPEKVRTQHKRERPMSDSTLEAVPIQQRRMDREAITEVMTRVATIFHHIPFIVSGLSAMVYYGFEGRRAANVTLLCPSTSRRVIRGWAMAKGLHRYPDRPDVFGVDTADGVSRMVRIKYVDEGFEDHHTLHSESLKGKVLSLAGLANQLAEGYVRELEFSAGMRQDSFATDMIWVLDKIPPMEREEHELTPQRCPHIWDDNFWIPFTLSFPDSVPLFGAAGFRTEATGNQNHPLWDVSKEAAEIERSDTTHPQVLVLRDRNALALSEVSEEGYGSSSTPTPTSKFKEMD